MKRYEEFTWNGTQITNAGLQNVVTQELIWDLEPMLVGKQILGEDTTMVGKSGKVRSLRKSEKYDDSSSMDFSEGGDVPNGSTPTASTVDVTPSKFGIKETITEDAIEEDDLDTIQVVRTGLLRAMARRADTRVWNAVFDPTAVVEGPASTTVNANLTGDGSTKKFSLTQGQYDETETIQSTPTVLLYVTSISVAGTDVTLGSAVTVDMYNGRIEFASPPASGAAIIVTYGYTSRPNQVDANTKGAFTPRTDGRNAKIKINSDNGDPDTIVLHTDEAGDMLTDDTFTLANEYGSRDGLLNGEIGRFIGLNVLKSQQMYTGVALVCRRGNDFGRYVYKIKPRSKVQEIQAKSGDIYLMMWEKSGIGIVEEDLMAVITNMQTYAAAITAP